MCTVCWAAEEASDAQRAAFQHSSSGSCQELSGLIAPNPSTKGNHLKEWLSSAQCRGEVSLHLWELMETLKKNSQLKEIQQIIKFKCSQLKAHKRPFVVAKACAKAKDRAKALCQSKEEKKHSLPAAR